MEVVQQTTTIACTDRVDEYAVQRPPGLKLLGFIDLLTVHLDTPVSLVDRQVTALVIEQEVRLMGRRHGGGMNIWTKPGLW